jgi:hypothetical protein
MDVQGDDVQGGDMQRMAVFPLDELRPRPGRCAGRSRVVREKLKCGGCRRIHTGAAGPRAENVEEKAAKSAVLTQADHGPRGGEGVVMARRVGRRSYTAARRAPSTHAEVEAGVTRCDFDVQRKTGGAGRPALMVSQQVERAAELQDPEVRMDLD